MKFIFDLDGTLTECETLPLIAVKFCLEESLSLLTAQTIRGDIPFMESFIKRVSILGNLNEEEVSACLSHLNINEKLNEFINNNSSECIVATGNYRGWIKDLAKKINCDLFCSEGNVDINGKIALSKILKKEELVAHYQSLGEKIVYIGDGNNDAEAMRIADISIACGIVHQPAPSVMQVADYAVYDAKALVRLLNQIKNPQEGVSIVISSAGVGSRLGLGQTKSLIKIKGTSLIHHQLLNFSNIEDVRIVVGFQALDLINEALRYRSDIIFAFNHDYFHTKTGASLYIGAQHANSSVIAWDGDLLVHPNDVDVCLIGDKQYIGISEKTSQEAVYVKIANESVVNFSTESGDYEWSGPACIFRDNIKYHPKNVFNQIEHLLPLPYKIIRARDIDTYSDYLGAIKFIDSWPAGNKNIHDYYENMSANIKVATETRN